MPDLRSILMVYVDAVQMIQWKNNIKCFFGRKHVNERFACYRKKPTDNIIRNISLSNEWFDVKAMINTDRR